MLRVAMLIVTSFKKKQTHDCKLKANKQLYCQTVKVHPCLHLSAVDCSCLCASVPFQNCLFLVLSDGEKKKKPRCSFNCLLNGVKLSTALQIYVRREAKSKKLPLFRTKHSWLCIKSLFLPWSLIAPRVLSTEQDNMKLIFQTLFPHLNKKRFHYLPAFCPLTYGHMVWLHERLSSQAPGPLGISLCWREAESAKS